MDDTQTNADKTFPGPTDPDFSIPDSPANGLNQAIARSQEYHFSKQYEEGYWVEELESNSTITAEYIFFMHFMGIDDPARRERMKNYLLKLQREDGGWNLFFGQPADISTTVEAYVALKMCGLKEDHPDMVRAREAIARQGGVRSARVFTKIFLAMLGQSSWSDVPAMPVEIVLMPRWFHLNIYEMSSWSRGTVVPLTLVYSYQPVWPLPPEHCVPEIFTHQDRDLSVKSKQPGLNWPNVFFAIDKIIKALGKTGWKPFRKMARRKALKWILKHQEPEGDFSGIQPAMINSMLALHLSGYSMDHPVMVKGMEGIERFMLEEDGAESMQACVSPLWDTAIAANALMDSGIPGSHPAIVKAIEWMIRKQVNYAGDWRFKNPGTPPGGWSFEFHNRNYPDTDDTAEILMAIDRTEVADTEWKKKEMERALTWLLSMQSANGGWGAFDQDNDHTLFNQIPFADHGAMLDPPTVDVTGRILWMLGRTGFIEKARPHVDRALKFIRSEQEPDGCWFGRWGVNYLYGTWLVLMGLKSIGEDVSQPYIQRAAKWYKKHQNEDGGWGETCDSYIKPELRATGNSTNSQTAWAVMALVEVGEADSDAVKRGVQYLIDQQKEDGSWYEDEFTGTGFPGHFYIRYHMYRQFFPLMALARYRNALVK